MLIGQSLIVTVNPQTQMVCHYHNYSDSHSMGTGQINTSTRINLYFGNHGILRLSRCLKIDKGGTVFIACSVYYVGKSDNI